MGYILQQGGFLEFIWEVWLFDGLYGQLEKYVMWLEWGEFSFVLFYIDEGGIYFIIFGFWDSFKVWGFLFMEVESRNG